MNIAPFSSIDIATFLLAAGVLGFVLANWARLAALPKREVLLGSLVAALLGWGASLIEERFLFDFWNGVEHASYALSNLLLALWCAVCFRGEPR